MRIHKTNVQYCFWLLLALIWIGSMQCVHNAESNLIHRSASLPETTPWDLESLSETPEFQWADDNPVRSLYYKGEPYKGQTTRVFAYYATPGTLSDDPNRDKNLPALVLVHGGGGTAFQEWVRLWAERGYAAIAMDLAGRGPDKERLPDGGPDQQDSVKFGQMNLPLTDQWTYHAVANVIKAHSLIRSFPEVNTDRTGIIGISWGGYLTCIVAGLDNRFKAAVPVYGCGFLHENSYWLHEFEGMSSDNKMKWIQYWDPSQYVGSTSIPIFFVNGGTDFAYPPDSYARTYDLVQSEKNIHFVPYQEHAHIFDRPKEIEVFIEHYLRTGISLSKISSVDVQETYITANIKSKIKPVAAALHYTLDEISVNPQTREWLTIPAKIEQSKIISVRPPEDAKIWFLTVTDEHEMVVSSKPMIKF